MPKRLGGGTIRIASCEVRITLSESDVATRLIPRPSLLGSYLVKHPQDRTTSLKTSSLTEQTRNKKHCSLTIR